MVRWARMCAGCVLLGTFLCPGCRPASGDTTPERITIDPVDFLVAAGQSSTVVLRRPGREAEALEAARQSASGNERRRIERELVVARMFETLDALEVWDNRRADRRRRETERLADEIAQSHDDPTVPAEMAFVKVFVAWMADAPQARRRAERFVEEFANSGDLVLFAWVIRGEILLRAQEYENAMAAFRFPLSRLGHSLYGYALYRTSFCLHRLGQDDRARQAMREVLQLGCERDQPRPVLRLAVAAAQSLGEDTMRQPDGTLRPEHCASGETPPSDDERVFPNE